MAYGAGSAGSERRRKLRARSRRWGKIHRERRGGPRRSSTPALRRRVREGRRRSQGREDRASRSPLPPGGNLGWQIEVAQGPCGTCGGVATDQDQNDAERHASNGPVDPDREKVFHARVLRTDAVCARAGRTECTWHAQSPSSPPNVTMPPAGGGSRDRS